MATLPVPHRDSMGWERLVNDSNAGSAPLPSHHDLYSRVPLVQAPFPSIWTLGDEGCHDGSKLCSPCVNHSPASAVCLEMGFSPTLPRYQLFTEWFHTRPSFRQHPSAPAAKWCLGVRPPTLPIQVSPKPLDIFLFDNPSP